jgi:hypothetical protein
MPPQRRFNAQCPKASRMPSAGRQRKITLGASSQVLEDSPKITCSQTVLDLPPSKWLIPLQRKDS